MPRPDTLTVETIEAYAEEVAARYEFNPEWDDIRDFTQRLGGSITVQPVIDLRHAESGSLVVDGNGRFRISLSPKTGRLRDNFTIAHELGHYFLHTGTPEGTHPGSFGRYGDTPQERQANRFAAALLMPQARFRELTRQFGRNIPVLAGCFNVSPRAAEVRLESLGL